MGNWDEFREFRARVEALLPTLATKAEVEALRADIGCTAQPPAVPQEKSPR